MASIVQGGIDEAVQAIKVALDEYEAQHPGAEAALYRQNSASIRVLSVAVCAAMMREPRRRNAR